MTTGLGRRCRRELAGRRRPPGAASIAAALTALGTIPAPGDVAAQEAAPGTVEVDPEAAERALERTLTSEGALLLAPGRVEIEPSVQYLRRESDDFAIARDDDGTVTNFGNVEVDRDETTLSVDFRLGLPYNLQFELGLPYQFVSSERTATTAGAGLEATSDSGSGLGDIRVGLAATVLREEAWRPDVVARVTWDADTAKETDGDLVLEQSFNEVIGSVIFLKRQDPLAFVASGFYQTVFEDDGIDPGDSYGFTLSATLAASPETSLSLGFQQSFSQDAEIDGRSIDNSGTTEGLLTLGASSILGAGILLNATLGVGLSEDAPDYFIRVSLPLQVPGTVF